MSRIRHFAKVLLCGLLALASVEARTVRVASFNIENGPGAVGTADYEATKAVLARIDADVVGFQELLLTGEAAWRQMAQELGYPHVEIGRDGTTMSGNQRLGYFSRFPIVAVSFVRSPDGANEITRLPMRAVVEVPGAAKPLVLWNMHHKADDTNAANTPVNQFRRAIEARRIVQDINAYRAAQTGHDEFVMLGDLNDDIFRSADQAVQFTSLPSGLPLSYRLGVDIAFPVAYRAFPDDRYGLAGGGLHRLHLWQQDGVTTTTRPAGLRTLDYILVSTALRHSPLGPPRGEVYHSRLDALYPGLPKRGSPLPSGTSLAASDHLALFADVEMADAVPAVWRVDPEAVVEITGPVGGSVTPGALSFTVTNAGARSASLSIVSDVPWLVPPTTGGLLPPGGQAVLSFTVNASAVPSTAGVFTGRLVFADAMTGVGVSRLVQLTVTNRAEFFTQQFSTTNRFNLSNRSVMFVPDAGGQSYRASIRAVSSLPTDPGGGVAVALGLDDSKEFAVPGGRTIPFFGTNHASYFIGSHGYITFTARDTEWRPSLTAHFRLPRISGLFYDIDPRAGSVRRQELPDRVAVTYLEVPESFQSRPNTFQIEMFFDGRIRLTWLETGASLPVNAAPPVVGLSPGNGIPGGFVNSTFLSFAAGGGFAAWASGQAPTPDLLRQYALGGAVSPSASGQPPWAILEGGRLVLSALVRDTDPDLRVVGETAEAVGGHWSTNAVTVHGRGEAVSQEGVGEGFERREFSVPAGRARQRFLRLRVELAD